MIKKLTRREKWISVACMIMILIYVGYNGVVAPLRRMIGLIDGEIQMQQRLLDKDVSVIQESEKLGQQYGEYLRRFRQSKTDEQVMASILSEIEEVAGEFGLRISELKPKKVKHNQYQNKFSVSLVIDGKFIKVLHFLHILQGQPHLFNLEEGRFDKISRGNTGAVKSHLVLNKILIP